MKRLSKKQIRRTQNRIRKLHRHKKSRRRSVPVLSKIQTQTVGSVVSATSRGRSRQIPSVGVGFPLPDVLCIETNRERVLDFIYSVRQNMAPVIAQKLAAQAKINRSRSRFGRIANWWKFEDLKEITPSAALMVAAEFHRFTLLTGKKSEAINLHEWHPEVYARLEQIGFLELLEITPDRKPFDGINDRRFLKFRSNNLASNDVAGELMEELELAAAHFEPGLAVNFERLHGALFEGLTNTKQHAHPEGYSQIFEHVNRWWATGAVDYKQRRISVVIYDQGITIPRSITSWGSFSHVQELLGKLGLNASSPKNDGQTIAAAMQVSKSSTRQPYRGLGLAEMERFMDTCVKGTLRVRSRYGEYIARANSEPQILTHGSELRGTLIEWELWV